MLQWQRNKSSPAEDGFTIRRRGDTPVRIRIILHLEHAPDRYNISHPLSTVIGMKQGSRLDVVAALWSYIKQHGLQDKSDRRVIRPDQALRQVFGTDTVMFQSVAEIVDRYLLPAEPVVLFHTVRVDAQDVAKAQAFDVPIDIDDQTMTLHRRNVLSRLEPQANAHILELDEQVPLCSSPLALLVPPKAPFR